MDIFSCEYLNLLFYEAVDHAIRDPIDKSKRFSQCQHRLTSDLIATAQLLCNGHQVAVYRGAISGIEDGSHGWCVGLFRRVTARYRWRPTCCPTTGLSTTLADGKLIKNTMLSVSELSNWKWQCLFWAAKWGCWVHSVRIPPARRIWQAPQYNICDCCAMALATHKAHWLTSSNSRAQVTLWYSIMHMQL